MRPRHGPYMWIHIHTDNVWQIGKYFGCCPYMSAMYGLCQGSLIMYIFAVKLLEKSIPSRK